MEGIKWDLFRSFFRSEVSGGFVIIGCTVVSLAIANSAAGYSWIHFLHSSVDLSFGVVQLNYTVTHWINDGLMTIFFLLVGLEIERELYVGELSSFKNALLPVLAAAGGMLFPALIYLCFNAGKNTQAGFGIPMATDIAFALGALSLTGRRVPFSLRIFLTALAIMDDLGAMVIIAIFYTKAFSAAYLLASLGVFFLLLVLNKYKVHNIPLYLAGGLVMWYCMLKSGVHASVAGVLLAFAVPFHRLDSKNPSYRLQRLLHYPVAFVILPVFALANTAMVFPVDIVKSLWQPSSLGILTGLVVGKFIGISLASWLAVRAGLATLSSGLRWRHIIGIAMLGGIGFTMSIFITNLAFSDQDLVAASKMSILLASLFAATGGCMVLRTSERKPPVSISL